jgi:hypothetical protein
MQVEFMNGQQVREILDWDRPLRFRRGGGERLGGLSIFFDFDWRRIFKQNISAFPRGKSLAQRVRRDCPEGKIPRLILTEREDVVAGFREIENSYFVIVPIQDYLNSAGADAASSYYARLCGSPLIQLATLVDVQFSPSDLDSFLDAQLTSEVLAAWLTGSQERKDILRSLVASETESLPAEIASALRGLEIEDGEVLREFANYVERAGVDRSRVSEFFGTTLETAENAQITSTSELDESTTETIRVILAREGGEALIRSLIEEGAITSVDVVNTAYRKNQLEIFKTLVDDENYWREYAEAESISTHSEEKVWQSFFYRNEWIFGYGLDYRFNGILQREFHASGTQADGSESVIGDFLLGDTNFTTFVEIKKPSTPLFGNSQNRSGSWCLSHDLVDSVSQILEQKASGEIKLSSGTLYNDKRERIVQKAVDSKVILIMGDWKRVVSANELDQEIKKKTFELYRRDSRNIKMLTYDELYERAKFIVEHKSEI